MLRFNPHYEDLQGWKLNWPGIERPEALGHDEGLIRPLAEPHDWIMVAL